MLNYHIQECRSLTQSMSLEHMAFLKLLITLKVRKQKPREQYKRCIARYLIPTSNCDDIIFILFKSEGKLCYKAYIHSTIIGTISLLSKKVKLNLIKKIHTALDDQ